jgi:hypothetical protein
MLTIKLFRYIINTRQNDWRESKIMSKFICLECGHVFDEEDIATWEENRGEYWGVMCSETVSGCPNCYGSYAKTYKCNCCDTWIDGEYIKLKSGERVCENCYITYELGEED